jgi:hypothetical protein
MTYSGWSHIYDAISPTYIARHYFSHRNGMETGVLRNARLMYVILPHVSTHVL